MLEHYKRTFLKMQRTIWAVAGAVLFLTHSWVAGASAFAAMQTGAVLGALWGARLKTTFLAALARRRGLPMRRA
jgi:hypothetical protein